VGFDENNEFYWHRGDKVSVLTAAGFREMILDDRYHGKTSGVFTGVFTGEMNDYVMYPSGAHVEENGQITYELPTSYNYSTIEDGANSFNPPMFGLINGGDALLTHLASFIKISVDNIPAGGDDMKFILTADKRITGGFLVDLTADPPVIITDDSEGNTVTIGFSNTVGGATGVFYVPVPLGMYSTITVEIKDGDILLASKVWTDQLVKRRTPKRGGIALDYVASTEGAVYSSLQDALNAAADNQVVTLDRDIVIDTPVVLANGKTVVLDLNGNTLSGTATSASASYLVSVKRGADLTIRNGSVIFAATSPETPWCQLFP
jgi:hypothetical protein